MIDIFNVPKKTTINRTLQSKSIMIVGKSKSGKSTIASQAPRPIFLMTENGGEALTGFTPIPIASWSDFKSTVSQLCSPKGRENFDTVVIDTYTNLILLLDRYIGQKMTTDKISFDFASDADYGKGTRQMRNELGIQLQKLANQGYLLLNIVHAEDKTDFATGNTYQDFADYYGDNRTEASGYIQYYIKNPNGWYYEITIRNNEKQTTPSDVMSEVPVRSVDFKIHPITEGLYALNE